MAKSDRPYLSLLEDGLARLGLTAGGSAPSRNLLYDHLQLDAREGRFRDEDLARSHAMLGNIKAFKRIGMAVLQERYPGMRADLKGAFVHNWHRVDTFETGGESPLEVCIDVFLPSEIRSFLGWITRQEDYEASFPELDQRLSAFRESVRAAVEPTFAAWRPRYAKALAESGPQAGFVERFMRRELAKTTVTGKPEEASQRLRAILDKALDGALKRVDAQRKSDNLRAVIGYDDYVARIVATRMPRRLVFHVGPTNSGKTHDAMRELAAAGTGAYLAPLRLLALEGYERLRDSGVKAGMLTGEEAIDAEGATHLSQTVETANLSLELDVAVLDEIQMLLDPDRGWAWTRALFGMTCRTLIMAGSEDALPLVEKAAGILGESVEVVRHERKAPLHVEERPTLYRGIGKGDALVAFSRRDVHAHREILIKQGHSVAIVYGALSPEVRRAEAERFASGEADVLVATDAIGMGLNLGPLRRVIFAEMTKFDGTSRRPLRPSEIRQIAGRAGRFGHHEAGYVTVMEGSLKQVRKALEGEPDPGQRDALFNVRPEPSVIRSAAAELGTTSLVAVLKAFQEKTVYEGSPFKPCAFDETIEAAAQVDFLDLPIDEKFAFACCPVDRRDNNARNRLRLFAMARANGVKCAAPPPLGGSYLEGQEALVKLMGAYLWLARRFPETFVEAEKADAIRKSANADIETGLRESATRKAERKASIRERPSGNPPRPAARA